MPLKTSAGILMTTILNQQIWKMPVFWRIYILDLSVLENKQIEKQISISRRRAH